MKTNGTKSHRSVHSEQNLLEGFTRHVLHIDRVIEIFSVRSLWQQWF